MNTSTSVLKAVNSGGIARLLAQHDLAPHALDGGAPRLARLALGLVGDDLGHDDRDDPVLRELLARHAAALVPAVALADRLDDARHRAGWDVDGDDRHE